MQWIRKSPVIDLPSVNVPEGKLLINWIGQAGFLVKTPGGKTLCIDPYLSNSIEKLEGLETRRMWWPAFPMDKLSCDAVLCTHDHLDHCDPETLPIIDAFAKPETYFGSVESVKHMEAMGFDTNKLVTLVPGDKATLGDLEIEAVFAKHSPDAIGLIMRCAGLTVYLTGDTAWCDEIQALADKDIDVLITCANGIYNNLDPAQACDLAKVLGVDIMIPMHFGTVPGNTVRPEKIRFIAGKKEAPCTILEPEANYVLSKCCCENKAVIEAL